MRTLFLTITISLIAGCFSAMAFRVESEFSESLVPERSIVRDVNGITVTYNFTGAIASTDDIYPECTILDIPGFGHNHNAGEPGWPIHLDSFEIPDGYNASVSILSETWCDLDLSISPARPLQLDDAEENHTSDDIPGINDFIGPLPKTSVTIQGKQIYRDRNILYIEVVPLRCIDTKITQACDNLTYRIDFTPSKEQSSLNTVPIKHYVDKEYMASLFTSTIVDEESNRSLNTCADTKWQEAPYYLVLSKSFYMTSVENFVSWKKAMGYNACAFYSDSWTPQAIKRKITSIYKVKPTLTYVLLVGDAVSMPPVSHNNLWKHYSDFTYGCMDGDDDMTQDVIIGRLNVSNEQEAKIAIGKIISYEKNPPTNDVFYSNSLHASYFQDYEDDKRGFEDRRFVRTSEDIRNGLCNENFKVNRVYCTHDWVTPTNWNKGTYGYGEDIPSELMKPNFNWDTTTKDVLDLVNSGCFYIMHRGHGSVDGWDLPDFKISSLEKLNNGNLLPMCFSIQCNSGAFGSTDVDGVKVDKSFSEALLRKSGGGAVGVIAASHKSYSAPNDVLAMEMFQAIWPSANILTKFPSYSPEEIDHTMKPIYSIGNILQKGISGVSEKYNTNSNEELNYTKRIYHCFGDPSMRMYTEKPHMVALMFNSDRPWYCTTNEVVQMSVVLRDGSVIIAKDKNFNLTDYKDKAVSFMISGPNIIPFKTTSEVVNSMAISDKGDFNIIINNGNIDVEYEGDRNIEAMLRIRSLSNSTTAGSMYPITSGYTSISLDSYEKGVYIVEIVESGIVLETKKIII